MKSTTVNLDKTQILDILNRHRETLKEMGVERIALFGSYAHLKSRFLDAVEQDLTYV